MWVVPWFAIIAKINTCFSWLQSFIMDNVVLHCCNAFPLLVQIIRFIAALRPQGGIPTYVIASHLTLLLSFSLILQEAHLVSLLGSSPIPSWFLSCVSVCVSVGIELLLLLELCIQATSGLFVPETWGMDARIRSLFVISNVCRPVKALLDEADFVWIDAWDHTGSIINP